MKQQHKSFVEVLQEQIRKELKSELRAEIHAELAAELKLQLEEKKRTAFEPTLWGPVVRFESKVKGSLNNTFYSSAHKNSPKREAKPKGMRESIKFLPGSSAKPSRPWNTVDQLWWQTFRKLGASGEIPSEREQLKKTFRKLALKLHPDRAGQNLKPEATQSFILLREAFEALDQRFIEFDGI